MKKLIFLLLSIVIFASSCRTVDEAANRHLRLAIKLNPNIIKNTKTDTTINGVASGKVLTPEAKGESGFDCDSIKEAYNLLLKTGKKGEVVLHNDSNVKIAVSTPSAEDAAKGVKPKLNYTVKPKILEVKVPYAVKVSVPGKEILVPTDRPFYVYRWFWFMLIIIIIQFIVIFKNTRPVKYVVEKVKSLKP